MGRNAPPDQLGPEAGTAVAFDRLLDRAIGALLSILGPRVALGGAALHYVADRPAIVDLVRDSGFRSEILTETEAISIPTGTRPGWEPAPSPACSGRQVVVAVFAGADLVVGLPGEVAVVVAAVLAIAVLFAPAYLVGLSAPGGYLGGWLRSDRRARDRSAPPGDRRGTRPAGTRRDGVRDGITDAYDPQG